MTNALESRDLKRRDEPGLASGLIPDWLDAVFLRTLLPAIGGLLIARVNPN
jgi:hypothetical protein